MKVSQLAVLAQPRTEAVPVNISQMLSLWETCFRHICCLHVNERRNNSLRMNSDCDTRMSETSVSVDTQTTGRNRCRDGIVGRVWAELPRDVDSFPAVVGDLSVL
jgi:hypothetical protein